MARLSKRREGLKMKCVVLQPSYIPWRGYFHQIQKADLFIFYDDVQYDKWGWRNRNRVKTASKTQWLTIPVFAKNHQVAKTPIDRIEICWNKAWNKKHWETIRRAYSKAPYFRRYAPLVESFYQRRPVYLADFTIDVTIALAKELGIHKTRFVRSSPLQVTGRRNERLLKLLQFFGVTHYITGPSAKEYLDEELLRQAGIKLEYMAYEYPPYPQRHSPFDPQVSILDLLFMTGPNAAKYIWGKE